MAFDAEDPSALWTSATGRASAINGADPALATSVADLLAVFAAAPQLYLLVAVDAPRFTILAASDAYLRATLLTREAAVGRALFEVLTDANPANAEPSGVANLRASLETVLRTGAPQRMPVQRYDVRRPDGAWEVRYWRPLNVPVRGPDGGVRHLLHHVEDVTLEVRSREELARCERRAEHILERVSDAHVALDRDFRVVTVNAAAERLLGKSRDAMLGRTHWEVFPASVELDAGRAYRRVVDEGVEQHLTQHYVGEGYDRHLEIDAYPTDDGGTAIFWRDVTGRVRAEEALRASEERFRTVGESGVLAVAFFREDGAITDANDAFLDLVGYTRAELAAGEVRWDRLTPPEWMPRTRAALEAFARTGHIEPYEKEYFRKSGERFWGLFGGRRIESTGEGVAFVIDITQRKRAEAALRESEARLRRMTNVEGVGVLLFDAATGTLRDANDAFLRMTGYSRWQVEAGALTWRVMTPPEYVAVSEAQMAQFARTGRIGPYEKEYLHADGSRSWMLFAGAALDEGTVVEYCIDVSDRHRAEAALRESEARYRALFESIDEGFCVVEVLFDGGQLPVDYRFLEANPAFEQQTGLSDVVGRTMRELAPAHEAHWFEVYGRVALTGEPTRFQAPAEALGRWFDVYAFRAGEPDERKVAILFGDITERKRAEAERERLLVESERARADAEAASRAKGEFLAVMSHELRTPLNAIAGYAELIELGIRGPVTAQQREDLSRIQRSQRHLLGLINEVLNYTKLETGAVQYHLREVRVCDAITEAEGLILPQARARGLVLSVAECSEELRVRADAEKLRQILVNLLSNAVKFTDRGGRVELTCGTEGGLAWIAVRDTGMGVPPEQLERIFEPFVQVRADLTRTHEGVGLGLAISRDLARGMGGDLTAESTAGAGSTFTLTLPLAEAL